MAGIRERDKRAVAGFWIRWRMGILYHVCSMFAICSFPKTGTGLRPVPKNRCCRYSTLSAQVEKSVA